MKIMFVGDLNLGEYYTAFGHGPMSYHQKTGESVFCKVKHIFDQADLVVGNLEAAITTNNEDPNDPERNVLKVHPNCSHQLSEAGVKLVQIANNHIVQHGDEGFDETVRILDSEGISYVGQRPTEPHVIHDNGQTIAFFAASDVPDNTNKQQKKYERLNEQFIEKIEQSVNLYDHIVVMLHWGLEESTIPLPYQRKLAERLKSSGVRAIIGSHPHLFYEIEVSKNFICAYSLGNFVFDLCWDSRLMKTGILEIDFTEDKLKCVLWPVSIKNFGATPTPLGAPLKIQSTFSLYDLGKDIKWQPLKKNLHFWGNIYRGNTILKLRFFYSKIRKLFNH